VTERSLLGVIGIDFIGNSKISSFRQNRPRQLFDGIIMLPPPSAPGRLDGKPANDVGTGTWSGIAPFPACTTLTAWLTFATRKCSAVILRVFARAFAHAVFERRGAAGAAYKRRLS